MRCGVDRLRVTLEDEVVDVLLSLTRDGIHPGYLTQVLLNVTKIQRYVVGIQCSSDAGHSSTSVRHFFRLFAQTFLTRFFQRPGLGNSTSFGLSQ